MPTTNLVLLACLVSLVAAIAAVDSKSDSSGEWHILTKQNFSSQIRLHPHILVFVTLPWSGECRSLMKDVAKLVTDRPEEFSSLKLMVLHRNTEKMVATAIGAASEWEEITVLYYHHSVSYKYGGRLRAQNILSSIRPYVSVLGEELPFKSLKSQEELKAFVDSTDKALVVFEFCEWTPKLVAKRKMNGTDHSGFGEFFGLNLNAETNRTDWRKNNQKGMETAKMKCNVDNELGAVPWVGDFSSVNDSVASEETENSRPDGASFCTLEEYQLFDSFFSKFMTIAREFVLPPERHKFGLVSERSMLSALGIGDSSSWLAVLYFAGCPSCLKIIKKEDDLNNALKMDSLVKELEGHGNALEPALPANQPSVLLFVDRSSDLLETRINGKEALDAFRKLALHYHMPDQLGSQSKDKHEKSSSQHYQALRTTSGHPNLKLSQTVQFSKLEDKMSTFTIINEGKQFRVEKLALDLKGNSLQDILEIVLKQKKKAKLSSLVKDLGFQLLSDDMDIKPESTLPLPKESESDTVTEEPYKEGLATSSTDSDRDQQPDATSISTEQHPETSEVMDTETSSQNNEEKAYYVDTSNQILSVDSEQQLADHKCEDLDTEEDSNPQGEKSAEQQLHFQGFKGSFFFSDGNCRLLRALTGSSKFPALVIVDPNMQQHYVFPEETNVNYSSLVDFVSAFLNGSLLPYQESETVLESSRKATQPPFVNLDFHQVDSIPRVTTHTFSELVVGFNQSDSDAWNKDVLVLFSNRWCGFCQRMELVVHEVYRAMKDYAKMLKRESKNDKSTFHDNMTGDVKNEMLELPLMYLLDCTLNDCSLILKSMNQREVYPTLVLFPAEKKHALPYEGDMAVTEIFNFMADHGSNSHHLTSEKGMLWTLAEKRGRNQDFFMVQSSDVHEQSKDTLHEVLLTNVHKPVIEDKQIKSHIPQGLHEAPPNVVVGSVLVATDKLHSVHPFDKSEILIVKADQVTGFQGLIINKHIRWDALPELGEGVKMLVEAPLSFGGPLIKGGMPLVALTQKFVEDEYPEILPGIAFLDPSATIQKIKELKLGNQSVTDYWFFFGYSSWGWDQLFDEIDKGAWNLSDDGMRHLDWPSS
ncbi:putative protein disulfide-isomerase [Rosa chinensis]|uniref:Thioredoxin domain-containing protein n=1 Tax=Rosa chinensis TaxID=74649 RepID=A0A2P6R4N7_ROSCH|nr:uncharacterized protein LOC112197087 isoform X1 [Rosa chinensis]PRQ41401.1 putative protein disulfide-isomerase [Rosa chinensis]